MTTNTHSFHIPVMGIGFTIDSPLKVAHYGIDSVISLVDDILIEKMRKNYCEKYDLMYSEITEKIDDYRAKRITSYLNMMNGLVDEKIDQLKNASLDKIDELKKYFNLLPSEGVKEEFLDKLANTECISEIRKWIHKNINKGSIDVNIMTKIDKDNYKDNEQLPSIYNDAHAALRGFAESDVTGSLVLSAGMNPRLYGYIEQFDDFYPKENTLKKKIVLKVSDYRSALIQGKFLAKKGIWVSEYRIESGLNCGGHAFATEGFLLGPILEAFKNNKEDLKQELHEIYKKALSEKEIDCPTEPLAIKVTAQGGVGTHEEQQFLLDYYKVDSVGWGSPFLLVPEATTVDPKTLEKLANAKENDLYLSNISPLGVPFNNLRGNTKDLEKDKLINKGRPGSSCPKKYVSLNKEFTDKSICTASRQYQHKKIEALEEENLNPEDYKKAYDKIVEKSCICVGLGTSALLANDLDTKKEGEGVSICPGPNMAYYSKVLKLEEMVGHIYGKTNVISRTDRPHMFIKELNIYIDYLINEIKEMPNVLDRKQEKHIRNYTKNLLEGIEYYTSIFLDNAIFSPTDSTALINQLNISKAKVEGIQQEVFV
ncbi:hypothetical protein [Joostella sp.]|uniref:hypothetical protein n=1 Tax=Joostella sp. TaxID=2231138 RepID=UPI003A9299A2